jgi:hypothetical protein
MAALSPQRLPNSSTEREGAASLVEGSMDHCGFDVVVESSERPVGDGAAAASPASGGRATAGSFDGEEAYDDPDDGGGGGSADAHLLLRSP